MGKIRGRAIKRAAKNVIEKYYTRVDADFYNNLSVVRDVTVTQSKKIRNQLAGYLTHLYNRVRRGAVKGIYIKSHEEEKERKESFIPKVGITDVEKVEVDPVTYEMIQELGITGNYSVVGSLKIAN